MRSDCESDENEEREAVSQRELKSPVFSEAVPDGRAAKWDRDTGPRELIRLIFAIVTIHAQPGHWRD